jgi:SRSO17 transposase
VDNCQEGVFAALCCRQEVTLVDERLYLPESWIEDPQRCEAAGIPPQDRVFQTKAQLALEMVQSLRQRGVRFHWVGCDSFYGSDPAFLRALEREGEIFVADVHKDQRIYLHNPQPHLPPPAVRGRKPTRLVTELRSWRVDQWVAQQPPAAWQAVRLRESTRGYLEVDILHQRVWLWDGQETQAKRWHLLVSRDRDPTQPLKYALSNALASTKAQRLAFRQHQRYWVERALQNGKSEVGLGDYQVRQWQGWHHHMTLCLMTLLFMLEERRRQTAVLPLLSGYDIRVLLQELLPRRDVTWEEVVRQMHLRHQQRRRAIEWAYRNQQPLRRGTDTS